MALFQSETNWVAYVGSSDLIPPEDRKSSLVQAILQNNLQGSRKAPISTVIQTVLATDTYARARSMIRYAEKEYVRGFPESTMLTSAIPFDVIEAAFLRNGVEYDEIYSTYLGGGLESQFTKVWLKENYLSFNWTAGTPPQWDQQAATVAIPVINPDTGTYYQASNQYTIEPQLKPGIDPGDVYGGGGSKNFFTGRWVLVFTYTDNNGAEQQWQVPGSIDYSQYYDPDKWLIFVEYLYNGEMLYWWYKQGTGTDPILEAYFDQEDRDGKYLPVIVMMEDKVWVDSDPESELYRTTNKMLRRLGTSVSEVKEEFQNQEEEDNQSKELKRANAEKWDFFIHFAVPIRTKERGALEYLYYFFQQLQDWSAYTSDDYFAWLNGTGTVVQPDSMMRVLEGGVTGYACRFKWSFIEETERRTGRWPIEEYGVIRSMKPGEQTSMLLRREQYNEFEYRKGMEMIFGEGVQLPPYIDLEDEKANEGINSSYFIVTRQHKVDIEGNPLPDGVFEYSHIMMFAPEMQYEVNTSDSLTKNAWRVRYADCDIWNDEALPDEEGSAFRFPVHYDSLKKVSRMHRSECIQAALSGTVTLRQKQKELWYAKGFWKWIIIIIAIILIVLSVIYAGGAGSEEGVTLIGAIVSASGATGFGAFVLGAILTFAFGYIISLASSLIGGTAGQIFGIIAMIAMAYSTYSASGFSWTGTTTSGFGQAMTFLYNVNVLIAQPTFAIINAVEGHQVEQDFEAFEKDKKQKIQELKDAYDGLGPAPAGIDPMALVQVFQNSGAQEMPDDFIARCTNNNPGQSAMDVVLYFTDICKELSKDGNTTGFIDGMFVDLAKQRGDTRYV